MRALILFILLITLPRRRALRFPSLAIEPELGALADGETKREELRHEPPEEGQTAHIRHELLQLLKIFRTCHEKVDRHALFHRQLVVELAR